VASSYQEQAGFTLIELLIVIIVLAIIAMIVLPHATSSSEEAKVNALRTNLEKLRKTIDLYYLQHNDTYPGENSIAGIPAANSSQAEDGLEMQLTRYTNTDGATTSTKSSTYRFGPYIEGNPLAGDVLPVNPFNGERSVSCDITTADITARVSTGSGGWKFYTKTGVLIADDGGHDGL